ncbi:MAG: ATP-dependent RNA helicase DbpA, partial [Epsilonproteobacteria bacterium]
MTENNNKFNSLNLDKDMCDNLNNMGYTQMTQIQEQSLPITLENKDLIAQAKTGSGKTASFGIALLAKLQVQKFRIQSMVLCPTRELAIQVADELKLIARFKHNIKITVLCGGMPYKPQVHSLSHQAHIIVGTPGRILKHLEEKSFDTVDIDTLVLDEADRMLDMGFFDDIMKVIDFLPKQRQTMLFSATYPPRIETMAKDILINPTKVIVESTHKENTIEQVFYEAIEEEKSENVINLFNTFKPESVLIFCNTKIACDALADELEDKDYNPLVLHSDLDQRDRNETLILFSNKSFPILIATDVASRGLDIDDIDLVINYDLPNTTEVYTHRIGRTARAGKTGKAVSLVNNHDIEIFEDLIEEHSLSHTLQPTSQLDSENKHNFKSQWTTLFINGGKKQKVRAGDILGALTQGVGL